MSTGARRSLAWILTLILVLFVFGQGYLFNQTREAQLAAEAEKEAQFQRVKLLLYASPDPMIMCDDGRHITAANLAAAALLGWKTHELIGHPVSILVAGDDQYGKHSAAFERCVEQLRKGGENYVVQRDGIEGVAVTRDGQKLDVVLSVSGVYYRDNVEFVATIRLKKPTPKSKPSMLKLPTGLDSDTLEKWIPPQIQQHIRNRAR